MSAGCMRKQQVSLYHSQALLYYTLSRSYISQVTRTETTLQYNLGLSQSIFQLLEEDSETAKGGKDYADTEDERM